MPGIEQRGRIFAQDGCARRRAFFFSLDAILAASLLVIAILSLSVYFLRQQPTEQSTLYSQDMVGLLSSIKMSELNDTYLGAMVLKSNHTNGSNSLIEQIGIYYVTGETENAVNLSSEIISSLIPSRYGFSVVVNGNVIFEQSSFPLDEGSNIVSGKRYVSGINQTQPVKGYSSRAFLSGASSRSINSYVFYGGYVGDGNISSIIILPDNYSSIVDAYFEGVIPGTFELFINGIASGSYGANSTDELTPSSHSINSTYLASFHAGENRLDMNFSLVSGSIGGGFFRVTTNSSDLVAEELGEEISEQKTYLPGIHGNINLYSGIDIAGNLSQLEIFLNYSTELPVFVNIGNTTVYDANITGNVSVLLNSTNLSTTLNYSSISLTTMPLRIGTYSFNLSIAGQGNADVILITDVSGSMDWEMGSDDEGEVRACTSPLINSSDTQRLSVAKCLDKQFVSLILNGGINNRVGLVSFSASANSYVNLTSNHALLNSTIDGYSTGGATCVSCAINRAYNMLNEQSDESRYKYIIVMTDGVTNTRSAPSCYDLFGYGAMPQGNYGTISNIAGGQSGYLASRQQDASWNLIYSPTSGQLNDIDLLNDTFGFAVGNGGIILMRNNSNTWQQIASPVSVDLNSVDIYNRTFGLAVGGSGNVIRWNGATWSYAAQTATWTTLYSVSIFSPSRIFASGTRLFTGKIYSSINSGSNWAENFSGDSNYRGVKIINSSLAYAVGNDGDIRRWTGTTWQSQSSPTSHDLYSIDAFNSSRIIAVGGNNGYIRIISWDGSSWVLEHSANGDSLRDIVVFRNYSIAVGEDSLVMEKSGSGWFTNWNVPFAFQGNGTTGVTCTFDQDSCTEENSIPALNANYSSCRAHNELNATVHSIGFGPIASCQFAQQTLQSVALCGNGSYSASSDTQELQAIYTGIAEGILNKSVAFSQQKSVTFGVDSILHGNSYYWMSLNKTGQNILQKVPLTTETEIFNNNISIGQLDIAAGTILVEAKAISYSGEKWTSAVEINTSSGWVAAFNLSQFGPELLMLGDPYSILLPVELMGNSTAVRVRTGNYTDIAGGSPKNKIIYTFLATSFASSSGIGPKANGCIWQISFEDGTNASIAIPPGATESCTYQIGQDYANDAIQNAVYNLLVQLDFDKDGLVDINIGGQGFDINVGTVSSVPYLWGPAVVEVRLWQ